MDNASDKLNHLIELCKYYRGVVIEKSILIEQEIEHHLIGYFVSDFNKFFDMHEVIINKMAFDGKIAALEELTYRRFPDDFEKKYSKLFGELRYVKEIRNKFAHYPLMTAYADNEIPKEISLINYKNGTEIKVFSKGDFELFNTRATRCMEELIRLLP